MEPDSPRMSPERKLVAIMFTDIVGYTSLMGADEQEAMTLLQTNREIHKKYLDLFSGTCLKEMGDGILAQFNSALDAIKCAMEIQDAINEQAEYKLRVGIHIGDVTIENEDIFGDGVNVASRIQAIADPGGIYISESVYEAIRGRNDIKCISLGFFDLKNVDHEVKIYALKGQNLPLPANNVTKNPLGENGLIGSRIKFKGTHWVFILVGLLAVLWVFEKITGNNILIGKFTGPKKEIVSMAVFPFHDMSREEDHEWLADGLCEELINQLARFESLDVKSFYSTSYFKNKDYTVQEASQMLDVTNMLEGSVRVDDSLLRISIKLIDTSTGSQLWAESFDRKFDDIIQTQTSIARNVTRLVIEDILPDQLSTIDEVATISTEAYQEFLKGKHFFRLESPEYLHQAREKFEKAIEIDSTYAMAYSWLAKTYGFMGGRWFGLTSGEANKYALKYLEKALIIDPNLNDALITRAGQKVWYDWEFEEGLKEMEEVYSKFPGHEDYIITFTETLCALGQSERAIEILNANLKKNPYSIQSNDMLGWALNFQKDMKKAVKHHQKTLELEPSMIPPHHYMAESYYVLGEFRNSYEQWRIGYEKSGMPSFQEGMIRTLFLLGEEDKAKNQMAELIARTSVDFVSPYVLAKAYTAIGEHEKGLDWLEQAYEEREIAMMVVWIDYVFEPLHSHPRFRSIIQNINFPENISNNFE